MPALDEKTKELLEKMHFGVAGRHSAVEICTWTKKAITGKGFCYKWKFYGADTVACSQMTPSVLWCNQRCIYCWRAMEYMTLESFKDYDPPEKIIEEIVKKRRILLSGFLGNKEAIKERIEEAYYSFPSHWAISLSGEPTLYPELGELIKLLKEKDDVRTVFLVTNGLETDALKKLTGEKQPIQLYISVESTTEELQKKINVPLVDDAWERLNKTLDFLSRYKGRKVMRYTLIKGYNDKKEDAERLLEMAEKAKIDFLEIKSYIWIGYSRKRLKFENMPTHEDVRAFSRFLEKDPFVFMDEHKRSRIVVLKNKESKWKRVIDFHDNKKYEEIKKEDTIYSIIKNYRKAIYFFLEKGIDYSEDKYFTIEEAAKELKKDPEKLTKELNEFLSENYE